MCKTKSITIGQRWLKYIRDYPSRRYTLKLTALVAAFGIGIVGGACVLAREHVILGIYAIAAVIYIDAFLLLEKAASRAAYQEMLDTFTPEDREKWDSLHEEFP